MREIHEHMRLIGREYRLTRPMLGLSAEMWRDPFDGGETGIARVRRTVQDGEEPFIPIEGAYDEGKTPWLVYAPEIRHEAMYLSLIHILAFFGDIDAAKHLDQRRFARAVFAQQGVDLAGFELKVHVLQGFDAGERLADVFHFEQILAHRVSPPFLLHERAPRAGDAPGGTNFIRCV